MSAQIIRLTPLERRRNSRRPSMASVRREHWNHKKKFVKTFEQWQAENPGVTPILERR